RAGGGRRAPDAAQGDDRRGRAAGHGAHPPRPATGRPASFRARLRLRRRSRVVNGRLAKRYARALFGLAREEGSLAEVGEELGRISAVFEEPRLRPLVLNPAIEAEARLRTTKAIASALA